jgi:TonB family protein
VVADPVFPYDLLLKGEGGSATVLFSVDEKGSPTGARVLDASDPEFGEALVAAVEMSAFSTPMADGHAVTAALMRKAEFTAAASGNDGAPDPVARVLAGLRAGTIGSGAGLDAKLTPRYMISPRYPGALREGGRPSGQAVVEFVVDRDGRARLPRVVSATDRRFGWAAATAVSQWVFDGPRRGGNPADVRVQIPFQFKPPAD